MHKLTPRQWLILILLTVIWGLNWPVMKIGVTGFPPLTFRTICMWLGTPVLGLVLLLVPLQQPGVSLRPIRQITGESEFNEVFFDGARTEGTLHLGAPGQGWAVAMYLLGCERGASTLGQQAHFKHELAQVVTVARKNGAPLGMLVIDEVIGKYERIQFAVALDAEARVQQIEIMRYSESHGQEVRLPAWRQQFAGKPATAALQVGRDIANISGATLSCTHVADGVRRLVTAVAALRAAGKLA